MSRTRAEQITDILRTEILRGQYRPGERLPSERDLASRFDAGRGCIREVIKKLEQLGIAQVRPGGVRIVPVEDATLEVLGHLMDLEEYPQPALVGQLFEVFGAMMSLSARAAIENATDEQIDLMRTLVRDLMQSMDQVQEYHTGWRKLGNYFIEINRNLVLRLIGNGLKTQFVGRLEQLGLKPRLDMAKDREFLERLDQAMARRDPEEAGNAIIGHFRLLKESLLIALKEQHGQRSLHHA